MVERLIESVHEIDLDGVGFKGKGWEFCVAFTISFTGIHFPSIPRLIETKLREVGVALKQ